MALVGEDSGINLPVSEAGAEWKGNILVHGLECLEHKGVPSRSRLDMLGEGSVDEVDKEGWGK